MSGRIMRVIKWHPELWIPWLTVICVCFGVFYVDPSVFNRMPPAEVMAVGFFCYVLSHIVVSWALRIFADWRLVYRTIMVGADQLPMLQNENKEAYAFTVRDRAWPPFLIWGVAVYDDSFRVYMGWQVFTRKAPAIDKATTAGITRRRVG